MIARLKDTLLLVGDKTSERAMLREIFQTGYNLLEAEGVAQAKLLLSQNGDCIAAVLADIPVTDNQQVRDLVSACAPGTEKEIPVLLVIEPTGTGEREEKAFALGATDVVYKPYTAPAIQRRVQIIVDFFLHKWHLEEMVDEQRETIRTANQVMVDALSAIIEHRNTESGNHVLRIRRFTQVLLEEVARSCPEYGLTPESIETISSAAALHDIGKIAIPDAILNKPGKLTPEEFEVMKTHATEGAQIVEQLSGMGDAQYLRYAYNIALYHHERWDGRGYPKGLAGDEIPICAQAVGLADVFDALTSQRIYKDAYACGAAINMILNGECGEFSPRLLACFKQVRGQFVALGRQYSHGYSPKSDQIKVPLPGPERGTDALNTLQIAQVKYQALLHYMDDTVLEVDMDNGVYHVVYNPNPDMDALVFNGPVKSVGEILRGSDIHPDDRGVLDAIKEFVEEFFQKNIRRRSFYFRLFSPTRQTYLPYELTLMRLSTGDENRRIITVIWHRVETSAGDQNIPARSSLHAAPALYGLVSSALRCRNDHDLTIDAGACDLLVLVGYSAEEIRENFRNSLTELVAPEDRELFLRGMEEHRKNGGRSEMEFRMLRKDAEPVWTLAKSRIYVEEDGQEYIYFAIRDNSQSKAIQQDMASTIERNRIVIDQSGSISFEWDLREDRMQCSHKWEEHFGYVPVGENYGTKLGIATHFHPDDIDQIQECVARIKRGGETASAEVRIANAAGKYLWCRITAAGTWDQKGELTRIVGIIQDIDDLKRATLVLKERAERDALTKLFNKASTQQLVTEYLAQRERNELAGLLVLDLDNFKTVNDSYGHLYGDAFLARVGTTLRRLFRSQDIIGRIGGDEFLILMKTIPSETMLRERCEQLLNTCRELFEDMTPDLNVSFSVGAVMIPDHGTQYNDLFRRADEALYLAKSNGKNGYELYDPQNQFKPMLENSSYTNTRIDSDEQPGMANGSFAQFVFRRLYESEDLEATIDEILAYIGEQFNVSRVYIFENNEDDTACSNTFEWCNEGIEPEKDMLQNVSYIDDIAGWPEVFDERGVLYCPDVLTLEPHIRAILEPQGIKSMLQCAIRENGVFRGYVGFDECTANRLWTQEQVDLLTFLAEVMAVFLVKKSNQERALRQAENLRSVLDRQDAWIYVIDPETCELKFLNAKAKSIAPLTRVGMRCHKAFMDRDSRCENCPAAHIKKEQNVSALIRNDNLDVNVRTMASLITWNGEDACLLTCYDLDKEKEIR